MPGPYQQGYYSLATKRCHNNNEIQLDNLPPPIPALSNCDQAADFRPCALKIKLLVDGKSQSLDRKIWYAISISFFALGMAAACLRFLRHPSRPNL
jgi:hypothetical protein